MFKPHINICSQCGDEALMVVKKMLCAHCNYKNKQAKKKAAGKKTGGYQYVRNATGEGQVMRETALNMIGDEPTRCFVCKQLIPLVTYSNMGHIISKKKFPLFRLNPDNLKILCHKLVADENGNQGCHYQWDMRPRSEIENDSMWQEMIELEKKLKEEYKNASKDY